MNAWQLAAALIDTPMSNLRSVRFYRKHYALTQDELARLLAVSQTVVSRLESDPDAGTLETALALQVLFGLPPAQVFWRLYQAVEEAVMARAVVLDQELRDKSDPDSLRKQQLLSDMVDRARRVSDDL
jgi:DNA-binding XRE family transcriptional regulator